jgi:hypothetical protein
MSKVKIICSNDYLVGTNISQEKMEKNDSEIHVKIKIHFVSLFDLTVPNFYLSIGFFLNSFKSNQ